MARFGLKIRLPTWAQPFLPVVTGLGGAKVRLKERTYRNFPSCYENADGSVHK